MEKLKEESNKHNLGDLVRLKDLQNKDFFTDYIHIWEVETGSRPHMRGAVCNRMRCHAIFPDSIKRATFKPGQVTDDYFKNDFKYLGNREIAEKYFEAYSKKIKR